MKSNLEFAREIIKKLRTLGVRKFCLCAGSRNSPLVVELLKTELIENFQFFDEKSAAFFALGLARKSEGPVAVVTTSGTAAAELLPAAVEAFYSGVALVLITADRPRRFRGTGAPQSIEQRDLFKDYVGFSLDLEAGEEIPLFGAWKQNAPAHLNLGFDEPLLSEKPVAAPPTHSPPQLSTESAQNAERLGLFLQAARRPLVILSGLAKTDGRSLVPFLKKLGAPVWAEATSQLREDADLRSLLLRGGERVLKYAQFDAVLRIGAVPQCRFWRDLENSALPVLSVSKLPFAGLSRGQVLQEKAPAQFLKDQTVSPVGGFEQFFSLDKRIYEAKLALFAEEPGSEAALFHSLSRLIPDGARVFLGNSLPVREWDLAAVWKNKNFCIGASRGANGIDGQVSTFLGWQSSEAPANWGIFGDLTSLYDLNGPWALKHISEEMPLTLVVVNNGGGKIFSRLKHLRSQLEPEVREKYFENSHKIDFEGWARLWNLGYEKWDRIPSQLPGALQSIVEIVPDAASSERFWERYEKLFEEIC